MKFQTNDLTALLKNLALENSNTLMTEYFDRTDSLKIDPIIEFNLSDDEKVRVQCQYFQLVLEHNMNDEDLVKFSAKKAYKALDCMLRSEVVDGHIGMVCLPLTTRCLDTKISVNPDGSESVYGKRTKPTDWRSTNFTKRAAILLYVFPSKSFILKFEDRSAKSLRDEMNKALASFFKENENVFKGLKEGELRPKSETLVIENEPTEAV